MPKYRFSAAAADGTVINGIEASTAIADLRETLLDRNLQPISISERKGILQFEITQRRVKKRELMHLCLQLAVFLRSGVSVIEAFVGFSLLAVSTWFAFFVAWRYGVKVWVDSLLGPGL